MRNKPIGIFDSGVGGLTALKEILKLMPNEDIVYFGDTARAPYGEKDEATLISYAKQNFEFLKKQDVKFILVACGTISSIIYSKKLNVNFPSSGVIKSACICATNKTKNKRVGILGTSYTVMSKSYEKCIFSLNPEIQVYQRDCPNFVPLIESGHIGRNSDILMSCAFDYLSQMKTAKVDTIILGCTHYPIISEVIEEIVGERVNLIDVGKEAARNAFEEIKAKGLNSLESKSGKVKIFISGNKQNFTRTANIFLNNCSRNDLEIAEIKYGEKNEIK